MTKHKKPQIKSGKPDCYLCAWRRPVPGDAHSFCAHPDAGKEDADPMMQLFAIFASVGRVAPVVNLPGAEALGIKLHEHGVRNGWANWPFNFDPVWLAACKGFMFKEDACKVCAASAACLPVGQDKFVHKPKSCPWAPE